MKVLVLPLTAMAAILIFSLWAGSYVQQQTESWEQLLEQAAQSALEEDWSQAENLLSQTQKSWERRKTFLHTIIEHSELNEAESLFAAQVTVLSVQLRLLAETQAVSIKNIL